MEQEKLKPAVHETAFIADGARVRGDVVIAQGSGVWYNAVMRGDEGRISVGEGTNIQDCVVVHSDLGMGADIGNGCTVGHGAVIRGAKIGDNVMVGMNSTIMTGVEIGRDSIVAANALVSYNKKFPPRSLIQGVPARFVRELTDDEVESNVMAAKLYIELARRYSSGQIAGLED
ncbi:Carbonic anhydrase or acetyltransferase, isoleucine patch superfamily [Desulfatibacillum alkenivorans DSM 16219]|jgi:carbonic anhydrase/acetyltransferase-like protein (isoleucine patch superfamily)|uniref:Carbonic anhydrase or acetyltransferase, isoleucine patch superfamily n=1 Tax=Desulfatibacillum alkenivorans DSM 16219 TaxID=1121393 RepID=A0A1M6D1Y3_9BACT|nr:gamma carbonic anhydrase family protein [Desulfatibacillum alkenivorans]SHI67256.1 Carbonic anhydrase or acetyltransferase, isoleucine patch superfamily [Desulfatibacillum alkenivorans DSM 16219]